MDCALTVAAIVMAKSAVVVEYFMLKEVYAGRFEVYLDRRSVVRIAVNRTWCNKEWDGWASRK